MTNATDITLTLANDAKVKVLLKEDEYGKQYFLGLGNQQVLIKRDELDQVRINIATILES